VLQRRKRDSIPDTYAYILLVIHDDIYSGTRCCKIGKSSQLSRIPVSIIVRVIVRIIKIRVRTTVGVQQIADRMAQHLEIISKNTINSQNNKNKSENNRN